MKQIEQKTFEVGEIGDAHLFRPDLDVRGKSVRAARNVQILVSGSLKARSGTFRLATAPGDGLIKDMVIQDTAFVLLLTHGRVDIYDRVSRSHVQTIASCPWTLAMLTDADTPLVVEAYDTAARVLHPQMPCQVIRRGTDGVWTLAADTPAAGIGGSKRQAYYRYAERGISLTPSATTGTITLTASASYFVPEHVGVRLRLQGREVEVTAVASSTSATATVIQALYPTMTVSLESAAGYEVGGIVEGRDSRSKGEVVAVSGNDLTVLMQSFTPFFYDATATPKGEQIIGANATARLAATPSSATPASVLDFDEQAESAVRGYAATGAVHRNRFWKARLPKVPFGILASAISDFQDYLVSTGDNDAIFEELGDTRAGVVRHILSAEQMLIGTSSGIYYVPESEANPIRPTSFSVNNIGPDGVSPCRPVLISEGAFFVENGGGSIIGVFPTGDVRRSWKTADVSQLASHLILNPTCMAYVSGGGHNPERYVYVVNSDGTMPVVYYSESAEVFGWTHWDTQGQYRSVCAQRGEAWVLVRRQHGSNTVFALEAFDEDAHLDGMIRIDRTGDYQGPATGQIIHGPDGPVAAEKVYRAAALAGATVDLMVGGAYVGRVQLNADGDFGAPDLPGDIDVGWNFIPSVELWPPQEAEDERAVRRRQRVVGVLTRWRGRYLAVNGKMRSFYRGGEDTTSTLPLRDELDRVPMYGWSDEPRVTISRPYPGPWSLLGVVMTVKK